MKKKNNLAGLFIVPVVSFGIALSAFMFYAPTQTHKPTDTNKQEKTSFVERAFEQYFEKEMGCSIDEFTHEMASID